MLKEGKVPFGQSKTDILYFRPKRFVCKVSLADPLLKRVDSFTNKNVFTQLCIRIFENKENFLKAAKQVSTNKINFEEFYL
jgi:hypothetical protein